MRIKLFNRTDELDRQITKLTDDMDTVEPDSPEFKVLMDRVSQLRKLRAETSPKRLDRNTMALIAGNLLGILLIVAYEQKHVLPIKPMNERMTMKPPTIG